MKFEQVVGSGVFFVEPEQCEGLTKEEVKEMVNGYHQQGMYLQAVNWLSAFEALNHGVECRKVNLDTLDF